MTNRSGLRYTFKIEFEDGSEQTITTAPVDAIRWEKAHAGQAFPDLMDVSRMMWVAWAAGRRQGLLDQQGTRDFEKWVETIHDFDADEDKPGTGEPDPTSPDRSESSTPVSPYEPDAVPAI